MIKVTVSRTSVVLRSFCYEFSLFLLGNGQEFDDAVSYCGVDDCGYDDRWLKDRPVAGHRASDVENVIKWRRQNVCNRINDVNETAG